MLIYFQALLAGVAGNQLQLGVGETVSGQVGQHLVTEQMWVDWLRQTRTLTVGLNDLLNAARRERAAACRLEQVLILRMSFKVSSQDEPKVGGKQDVAVLGSFTLPDEDAALVREPGEPVLACGGPVGRHTKSRRNRGGPAGRPGPEQPPHPISRFRLRIRNNPSFSSSGAYESASGRNRSSPFCHSAK